MLLGSIGRSHLFGGCNQAELRDLDREDKAWRSQLVVGAWKAQVHGVD